jgi:hypothetical protein
MKNEHDDDEIAPIPNPSVPECFGVWLMLIAASWAGGAALLLTARWIIRVVGH